MSHEAIACILQQEAEAVLNIPVTSGYEEAVTLIVKYVHELGGKLITSGMGKAGQIAMNIPPSVRPVRRPFSCIPAKHNMATWVSCVTMISCY